MNQSNEDLNKHKYCVSCNRELPHPTVESIDETKVDDFDTWCMTKQTDEEYEEHIWLKRKYKELKCMEAAMVAQWLMRESDIKQRVRRRVLKRRIYEKNKSKKKVLEILSKRTKYPFIDKELLVEGDKLVNFTVVGLDLEYRLYVNKGFPGGVYKWEVKRVNNIENINKKSF